MLELLTRKSTRLPHLNYVGQILFRNDLLHRSETDLLEPKTLSLALGAATRAIRRCFFQCARRLPYVRSSPCPGGGFEPTGDLLHSVKILKN